MPVVDISFCGRVMLDNVLILVVLNVFGKMARFKSALVLNAEVKVDCVNASRSMQLIFFVGCFLFLSNL